MTNYHELKDLQAKARVLGYLCCLYINEEGVFNQVYIDGVGLRDPLSAAEYLRAVVAKNVKRSIY